MIKIFIRFLFLGFLGINGSSAMAFGQANVVEDQLAVIVPVGTESVGKALPGKKIFSDQLHEFYELPSILAGTNYIRGSMDSGVGVIPVTTGFIYVITPIEGQIFSQESLLRKEGFVQVQCNSFRLFKGVKQQLGIFRKKIGYERFRLPRILFDSWVIPFFSGETLPSVSSAANILSLPGKEYAVDTRLWQGCPSIEKTGKRLWAAWFSGGKREPDKGNYGIIGFSDDEGNNWTDPAIVIAHPDSSVRVMDPQIWTDPMGRLWIFWVQNTGAAGFDGIWGTWAIRIDNPESKILTWTLPKRLCDGLTRNKPLILSTGEWLLPSYNWAVNNQSAVYISKDKGESWTMQGGPLNLPSNNFFEHMVVELENGKLWMLQRNIEESYSENKGAQWTPLKKIQGMNSANSRLFIGRLNSGNLLLIYNEDSTGGIRRNLTALLSEDDGKTWPHKLLLDEREEVSYPDVVQDDNGLIYVCYDRSRRGEKEILYARFSESELKQGRIISGQSFQKRIISKVENNLRKIN